MINIVICDDEKSYHEILEFNMATGKMATGKNHHVYSTLKEFEKELTPNFLSRHKSYMVNMNFIAGYEPYKFLLKNSEQVGIPPKKYAEMIDKYRNYLINL